MSLSIMGVINFWATQPSLTSLVPASSVWLDIPGDGGTMPYVVATVINQKPEWMTNGTFVSRMRFQFAVYAPTLAQVNTIVTALIAAYKWSDITGNGFGCRLENVIVKAEDGGAYSCIVEFTLMETLT